MRRLVRLGSSRLRSRPLRRGRLYATRSRARRGQVARPKARTLRALPRPHPFGARRSAWHSTLARRGQTGRRRRPAPFLRRRSRPPRVRVGPPPVTPHTLSTHGLKASRDESGRRQGRQGRQGLGLGGRCWCPPMGWWLSWQVYGAEIETIGGPLSVTQQSLCHKDPTTPPWRAWRPWRPWRRLRSPPGLTSPSSLKSNAERLRAASVWGTWRR